MANNKLLDKLDAKYEVGGVRNINENNIIQYVEALNDIKLTFVEKKDGIIVADDEATNKRYLLMDVAYEEEEVLA